MDNAPWKRLECREAPSGGLPCPSPPGTQRTKVGQQATSRRSPAFGLHQFREKDLGRVCLHSLA